MNTRAPITSFFDRASVQTLQWLVWTFVWLSIFFSYLSMDGWRQSSIYSTLNCIFYATLIYTNILLLFPKLYAAGKKTGYFFSVILLILTLSFIRGWVYWKVYNTWFVMNEKYALSSVIYSSLLSNTYTFILSLVFRIALAYFGLKKQAQEMLLQKSQAELNLLKSQVQPHFLFNTLNNIYYETYRESPRSALLIDRLSEIMRYFVDESPRQYVKLSTEVRFLENYMALEQIRVRHGVTIRFDKTADPETMVPPMLLMTFVENLFKHGINKAGTENVLDIRLSTRDNRLHFETRNRLYQTSPGKDGGFGIKNLRERLVILYGNDFLLDTQENEGCFAAKLSFPLNHSF